MMEAKMNLNETGGFSDEEVQLVDVVQKTSKMTKKAQKEKKKDVKYITPKSFK